MQPVYGKILFPTRRGLILSATVSWRGVALAGLAPMVTVSEWWHIACGYDDGALYFFVRQWERQDEGTGERIVNNTVQCALTRFEDDCVQ